MLNVRQDELVVDEKGIYSIEQYLTARMFMYWQVYFHKAAVIAEHLLVKVLKRAKYLIGRGYHLEASENIKYFLYKTDFEKATEQDIKCFTELDDNDILQAIKLWEGEQDFILSYLCKTIIRRKFPKIISSAQAFREEEIQQKISKVNHKLGITEGDWLVDNIERKLLPYDEKLPIVLFQKNGECVFLEKAQNQILSANINKENKRFILAFPREIL